MRSTLRYALRGLVVLALVALVATCADQTPVTPPDGVTSGEIGEPANTMNVVASVTCTADVEKGQVDCGDAPVLDQETGAQRVIVGGQGIFVQLVSSNVSYDVPSETFQADVQVGNYMPLILGTPDGLSVTGIRVFHHSGPTVTGGTGTVSVQNADGTATFTGANQPYFSYGYHLPQGFITPAAEKTWKWDVESTVSTFTFEVYVDADIANPNGFVSMSPASALMTTGGGTLSVTGTARDHVGRAVVKTVTYSSADPTIASVNPSTGEVTAVSAGVVDIIGTTGGPETDGIMRVTVDPPTGGFDINFHFKTTITPSQELAFTDAAAKWTSLVTGDLGTELVQIPFVWCGGVVDEYVDDLTINVL
ncbi:MAG: Ig-like domain-containing protein, partial [Gemmatimonadales bacterium]